MIDHRASERAITAANQTAKSIIYLTSPECDWLGNANRRFLVGVISFTAQANVDPAGAASVIVAAVVTPVV